MKTTTQVIWQDFLNLPDYLPEKPPKTIDAKCWLCGGDTHGTGWDMKKAIGGAFTDNNIARATRSNTVCCSCAALTSKDMWVIACEKHHHSPYFPVKDDKKPFLSNWMFSSHVFSTSAWLQPSRQQAREILLNPPAPPFVITLAAVGKKHVIFRAPVNHDRERFFVQFDTETICIDRCLFAAMLEQFESFYELGLSKDSLVTGNYNQASCMQIGVQKWREIENVMQEFRRRDSALLKIVSFVSVKKL
jgi:hypothetical protein